MHYFLCFKFFSWKVISFLSNDPFNNNISIFDSKIVYFYLRSNFRGWTTLSIAYMWMKFLFVYQHSSVNFAWIDFKFKEYIFKLLHYKNMQKRKNQFFENSACD